MDKNFSIPKEFESFVSNSSDLLDQIKLHINGKNELFYYIYSDHIILKNINQNDSINYLNDLKNSILNFLSSYINSYLWEVDSFTLEVNINNELKCLVGMITYGDSLEDEWYVIYLLLILSKQFSELNIKVLDNDGQFLLIEACDYLPSWVEPENSENRFWIRQGKVHLIPLNNSSESLKLTEAIKILMLASVESYQSSSHPTLANEGIQSFINSKTIESFPHRHLALQHTTAILIPSWLKNIYENDTSNIILRYSIQCYNNLPSEDIPKVSKNFYSLSSFLVKNIKLEHNNIIDSISILKNELDNDVKLSTPNNFSMERLSSLSIKLTRAQYAKLNFKNFQIPRRYNSLYKRIKKISSPLVEQAFILGCKLLIGFESFMTNLLNESIDYNTNQEINYSNFDNIEDISSFFTLKKNKKIFETLIKNLIHCDSFNSDELFALDLEEFDKIDSQKIEIDSDDWLYLSPAQFEEEIEKRINYFQNKQGNNNSAYKTNSDNNNSCNSSINNNSINSDSLNSSKQIELITSSFKNFLEKKSDFDGIQVNDSKKNPLLNYSELNHPLDGFGQLNLNYIGTQIYKTRINWANKFKELEGNNDNNESDDSEENSDMNFDSDSNDSEIETEEITQNENEISIEDFQDIMDSEVFDESALLNTFANSMDFNDDFNLISNFLKTQEELGGIPMGPASHILQQLGLSLPKPPPINKK